MSKVLQADAGAADARGSYVELDLGAGCADIWVTLKCRLDSASYTAWRGVSAPTVILLLRADHSIGSRCGSVAVEPSADPMSFPDSFNSWWGSGGGTPTPDIPQLIEYHRATSGDVELYIDGTLVDSGTDAEGSDVRYVRVGLMEYIGGPPALDWIDDVKIGTTRGADDLGSDDFESGTLAAWTTTHDDVSVVDDPPYPLAYAGNGSDGGTPPIDGSSPYAEGDTVTVLDPGALSRLGYTFDSWNTIADGSGTSYAPADTFAMPAAAVTLYAQWTPVSPPNDNFADAILLDGIAGTVDAFNMGATAETPDPLNDDHGSATTIWYKYVAPGHGDATFATSEFGGSPIGDTILGVYTGDDLASLVEVAFNDDDGIDSYSSVTIPVATGITYFIEVAGFGEAAGTFALSWDGPLPGQTTLFIKIYDLGVTELADISKIALEKSMPRIANGPRAFTVQAPANDPLLTALWEDGDGEPILGDGGTRKLVVWENSDPDVDDPIFHGRIFGCERDSDENSRLVTITAFDPWVELGFEADDRGGRIVRDGTPAVRGDQNFLTLHFTGSVDGQSEISGPDLIRQVLTYCQADPTADPIQGAGPLPIDVYSGEWDLDVPPAIDLDPRDTLDWPTLVGDFIQQLIDTNVVDFDLRPIRPGTGRNPAGDLDNYIMVEASAKSKLGVDRHETVHFDHLTGSYNAKGAREVTDFSKQNSHLWYELGPRLANEKWRAQLQPHDQPLHSDLLPLIDAAADKYGGPADAAEWGYNEFIRVFDSLGTEASSRPLYEALYRYEIMQRLEPRKLLYITPADGAYAIFTAPQDFDAFDEIQINVGADFGKVIDEVQRCYGYTKTWTRENIASLGQLLTSADVG